MVIGIDARTAVSEGAGRGRVARELIRALAARDDDHRYRLFGRERLEMALDERFAWVTVPAPDPIWHLRVADAASETCAAFLSLDSFLTVPLTRVPAVGFVHDLLSFDPAAQVRRRFRLIERATVGPAVRAAAGLVCTTHATEADLLRLFPAAAGKTSVVPLAAAATAPGRLPEGTPERFVLAVGTLEPRKNLPRLAAAYGELEDAPALVLAGRLGWDTGETLGALDALGDRCVRLGYVGDDQLAALYAACTVFAYPSLGEGFGLPVLEALRAGAPTLTSDRSSLPEVAGAAAEYVDPFDVTAIAAGLQRLLGDEPRRAELAAAGPRRAAEFSWDRTAAGVLAALTAAAPAVAAGQPGSTDDRG